MAVDPELYVKLVLLGILHWVLAVILLHDLADRKRVMGGRKAPWVLVIVFVAFLGSLLYLLCHPNVFIGGDDE